MVQIREVGADGWQAMRDIRLAALRDAPDAFASTYEREAAFAEADWQRWIAGGGNFLAYVPELGIAPAGIAGGFEAEPGTIELVSMWIRPDARGHGIGQALVETVIGWARGRGYGQQMRGAVLALAFGPLQAQAAITSAWHDNHASLGVSRALGYRPNGESLHARGERVDVMQHMRLRRADWLASGRGDHVAISGFDACRPLFGLPGR